MNTQIEITAAEIEKLFQELNLDTKNTLQNINIVEDSIHIHCNFDILLSKKLKELGYSIDCLNTGTITFYKNKSYFSKDEASSIKYINIYFY